MDRAPIELGSFHHVYNRGTDKRVIFNNDEDFARFTFYLNILNNIEVQSPANLDKKSREKFPELRSEYLVNLIAFCLMPNHFHLLLQERVAGGISKFMHRLSTAYTMYFNEINVRSGALFQGRFRSRFVDSELYLLKVIDYIHSNPKKLKDSLMYEWSSYHYYCGENKFGNLLQLDALKGVVEIARGDEYRKQLESNNDFSEVSQLSIDGEKII